MGWICDRNPRDRAGARRSFHAEFPDNYEARSPEKRSRECVLEEERCSIAGQEFYVLGSLEVPVTGDTCPFQLGVWALVSEDIFDGTHASAAQEPRECRLGNDITEIGSGTWMLRCAIRFRETGQRPLLTVNKPGHPLAVLQQCGMTEAEAEKLAERFLHRIAAK